MSDEPTAEALECVHKVLYSPAARIETIALDIDLALAPLRAEVEELRKNYRYQLACREAAEARVKELEKDKATIIEKVLGWLLEHINGDPDFGFDFDPDEVCNAGPLLEDWLRDRRFDVFDNREIFCSSHSGKGTGLLCSTCVTELVKERLGGLRAICEEIHRDIGWDVRECRSDYDGRAEPCPQCGWVHASLHRIREAIDAAREGTDE